jgi:trimethylamine--corrinoid protein Co-methyltransferase
LTIGNAEAVSAMVLMQLVAPGAPVFQSLLVSAMDPQSAEYLVTLPEKYLCNVAAIQMAHDWGVPSLAGTFGLEHAEPATWPLGRDSVYTALMCALAGTDLTIGLGLLDASTVLVPEQIIFDDEIYHTHRRLAQGLDITPDRIALDVIEAVGPGGHFLSQKHTRTHMRNIWIPTLTHPRQYKGEENTQGIQSRARAKLDQILSEHEPIPLEQAAQNEINLILQKAGHQLGY